MKKFEANFTPAFTLLIVSHRKSLAVGGCGIGCLLTSNWREMCSASACGQVSNVKNASTE